MTVNTAARRRSAAGVSHVGIVPLPVTSGVDAGERATLNHVYGGVDITVPAPTTTTGALCGTITAALKYAPTLTVSLIHTAALTLVVCED